jgi:pilus assembly protein Flp/PilA
LQAALIRWVGVVSWKAQVSLELRAVSLAVAVSQRRNTMKSLALSLHRFLSSEEGPTAVEYAVMLSLIVIVCLSAISSIGSNASTAFSMVANSISH